MYYKNEDKILDDKIIDRIARGEYLFRPINYKDETLAVIKVQAKSRDDAYTIAFQVIDASGVDRLDWSLQDVFQDQTGALYIINNDNKPEYL